MKPKRKTEQVDKEIIKSKVALLVEISFKIEIGLELM